MPVFDIICPGCETEDLGTVELPDGVDPAAATSKYLCGECALDRSGFTGPRYWLVFPELAPTISAGAVFPDFDVVLRGLYTEKRTDVELELTFYLELFHESGEGEDLPPDPPPPLTGTVTFTLVDGVCHVVGLAAPLTPGKFSLSAMSPDPKFGRGLSLPFEVVA